ncbi:MAG: amidohydrolase family protein [Candidatus Aminicenantes bacterium]|nr:amidohydrolase family protein [Candidatus Aminicenantes bacterium]NIM82824.1 amidohydrolase family protein [Candidatus Aminicenantes bacterium]NIN22200.1 amidohydrolase family protein [Candidatus Aminicenantes bacterium]NIN45968.1 amidohydrolase family protein [Candidatus Aminicenantes bacterium]NIN88804.1 amidohydrolase family protein [Candidatus Aminicenantes bacterium]
MTIIDFHNHFYPPEYVKALETGSSNIKVTYDNENNPLLHYPGDYNILVPGHRDIDFRAQVLEKAGIDKQIITFTTPGTHIESPKRSVELAQMVNDSFARIVRERSDRFAALATLPLNDPAASVTELIRVFDQLGFKGVMVYSNVNGIALSDKQFWPLYEKADELNAVFYIHPSFPVGVEAMTDYWLMPLVGFTFDTTLAASKLVFSGVVEKFPGITWVLGHLGGAIPYLAERLDRGYHAFKECRENISCPPSTYLKEFYYDTVNFDIHALQLAIDFAGPDHLVAGSDYPHQIGSLTQMKNSIDQLQISPEEKAGIYGENAARLLALGPRRGQP